MNDPTPKAIQDLTRELTRLFVIVGVDKLSFEIVDEGGGAQVQIAWPFNLLAAHALATALHQFMGEVAEDAVTVLSSEEAAARHQTP